MIVYNNEIEFTVNKLKSINQPIVCEIITSENQPVLFKQKYKKNGPVNFIPQSLSDMEP